ncbi:hypothetical protein AGLY_012310, partial [Aphis glycines]
CRVCMYLSEFFVLFFLVNLLGGIERNYDVQEHRYKFIIMKCCFCGKGFLFEQTLLFHISNYHVKKISNIPRERPKVLSRYTNVQNILNYIKDEELEKTIVTSDTNEINKIATDYIHFKFAKKLEKKIAVLKKQSKDILKSQTALHYSKFLITKKLPIQKHSEIISIDTINFFNNIQHTSWEPSEKFEEYLMYIKSIRNLDFLLSSMIQYETTPMLNRKVKLRNIEQTYHYAYHFSVPKSVILERWWTKPFIDMGYSQPQLPTTIGNIKIILDDESLVEFFVQTSDIDFNKNLILACLYVYYKYSSMNNKDTMSNVYNHITVVMCIIRHRFINKSGTKKVLLQLVKENYITKTIKHEYQAKLSIIEEEITKHKNISIINEILNIKEEVYMRTAVFYNVIIFVCFNQDCNF